MLPINKPSNDCCVICIHEGRGAGMANREHVDRLKQGVVDWNRWRVLHPEILADLSGAYLEHANLSHANLQGIYLGLDSHPSFIVREPHRMMQRILEIDIYRSKLSGTNLRYADLSKAYLGYADLSNANLSNANLSEAELRGTLQ